MNHYELLLLISGKYADTEVSAAIKKIEDILAKHGASIHYSQNLERKKLAFPIDHQTHGTYLLFEFDCEGAAVLPLDRDLRLSHDVMRHTIVKRKKVGSPKVLLQDKKEYTREVKVKDIDALIMPMIDQAEQAVTPTTPPPTPTSHNTQSQEKEEKQDEPLLDQEDKHKEEEKEEKEETDTGIKKKKQTKYKDLDERLEEILRNDIL